MTLFLTNKQCPFVSSASLPVLPLAEGILYAQLTANFFTMESAPMREQNTMLSLCFLALAAASLLGNMAMGCGFSVAGFRLTRRLRAEDLDHATARYSADA